MRSTTSPSAVLLSLAARRCTRLAAATLLSITVCGCSADGVSSSQLFAGRSLREASRVARVQPDESHHQPRMRTHGLPVVLTANQRQSLRAL